MFDDGVAFSGWHDRGTLQLFTPARTVTVDMTVVDPTAGRPFGFAPTPVPLRVRAFGALIEQQMIGEQLAWVRMTDGQWRGLVRVRIESANKVSAMVVTLWVPPHALRVVADGAKGSGQQ